VLEVFVLLLSAAEENKVLATPEADKVPGRCWRVNLDASHCLFIFMRFHSQRTLYLFVKVRIV
jgi:hypothetical protein